MFNTCCHFFRGEGVRWKFGTDSYSVDKNVDFASLKAAKSFGALALVHVAMQAGNLDIARLHEFADIANGVASAKQTI